MLKSKTPFFKHGNSVNRLTSVSLICPMPKFPCFWKEEIGSPCLHHLAKANKPCPVFNMGVVKENRR